MKKILIIEPTWPDLIHCPGNAGLISIAAKAFPNCQITYVGEQKQSDHIIGLLEAETANNVNFIVWDVWQDSPSLWSDQWKRRQVTNQLSEELLTSADLILLSSATATMLNEITWRGLATKSLACLHGNANDFLGWRSRNPLRRIFDLTASAKRFTHDGGRFLVMEERIATTLQGLFPFMMGSVACLPHPLTESEARPVESLKPLGVPISIGFAGNASLAKGFREFSALANQLTALQPGAFEFHAIGFLPTESRDIDQTALTTRSTPRRLERSEFKGLLLKQDFMFQWHADEYYELSASGVIYDAINMGIPLIARYGSEIKYLQDSGKSIGLALNSIEEVAKNLLSKYQLDQLRLDHALWQSNLIRIRGSLSNDALAHRLCEIV